MPKVEMNKAEAKHFRKPGKYGTAPAGGIAPDQ
jgi:hypothetical protein